MSLRHEKVKSDLGRVAVQRGPLVYCAEGADNGGQALNLVLPDDTQFSTEHRADLLGGVTLIRASGLARQRAANGDPATSPTEVVMIPYYAWNHRGPNAMAVWLPRTPELAALAPRPTVASQSRVTASHVHPADALAALNDQVEPAHSNDHEIPRFTWWDHRGTSEWVQYDFPAPTTVRGVEIYWFDDTGRGQCRVPASWHVRLREGDAWQDAAGEAAPGVERDQFNRVTFAPRECLGIRVEVQLQPGFSGGILEWRLLTDSAAGQ